MKPLIYLSFCLLLFISCSKDNDDKNLELICSFANPIDDLEWLKAEIELLKSNENKYESVIKSVLNDQIVFIFNNCNPMINSVILVKDCTGEDLGIIGEEQDNIKIDILENGIIIWKSEHFECDI